MTIILINIKMFQKSYSRLQSQKSKTFQQLNSIATSKKPDESDFRVHFSLMNVKWKNKESQKQQKLVDYTSGVINLVCRVQIVQIKEVIADDQFDISVGLFNDGEAYQFLKKKPVIVLSDGNKDIEYHPFVSRIFQSYMNKLNLNQDLVTIINPKSLYGENDQHENSIKPQTHEEINEQNNSGNSKSRQIHQKVDENVGEVRQTKANRQTKDKLVYKIWAFGIPRQYQIPQIKVSLKQQGIETGECQWRTRQYMQYLQIELLQPISKSNVYYLGLQIEGYPYVPIPALEDTQIVRQLSRYTVQIIIRSSEDEEEKFMHCMNDIGGINLMLRTPLKDKEQFRYLIVFNNVDHAERACRAAKDLRDCSAQRKQYELKVGRICRFYTFTALMQQINMNRV